jgi:hypothetical protein
MLGNGGLLHGKCFDDLSDRPFRAKDQEVENLAPARLSHRIESIRGCRCSRHAGQYIPLWEYVKTYFCKDKDTSEFRAATSARPDHKSLGDFKKAAAFFSILAVGKLGGASQVGTSW